MWLLPPAVLSFALSFAPSSPYPTLYPNYPAPPANWQPIIAGNGFVTGFMMRLRLPRARHRPTTCRRLGPSLGISTFLILLTTLSNSALEHNPNSTGCLALKLAMFQWVRFFNCLDGVQRRADKPPNLTVGQARVNFSATTPPRRVCRPVLLSACNAGHGVFPSNGRSFQLCSIAMIVWRLFHSVKFLRALIARLTTGWCPLIGCRWHRRGFQPPTNANRKSPQPVEMLKRCCQSTTRRWARGISID